MRDGVIFHLHQTHVFPCALAGLADRIRNFVGFANGIANPAAAVTRHHESGKAEAASAFHHFGGAVDVDNAFFYVREGGIIHIFRHKSVSFRMD